MPSNSIMNNFSAILKKNGLCIARIRTIIAFYEATLQKKKEKKNSFNVNILSCNYRISLLYVIPARYSRIIPLILSFLILSLVELRTQNVLILNTNLEKF